MSKKIIAPANGLTDTFIKKLKIVPDKDSYIADRGCKGLRLKISKNGTKSFVTTIYCNGVRHSNVSLGRYPHTGLSKAREILLQWKAEAKNGEFIPPKKQKELKVQAKLEQEAKLRANSITLGIVMDEFINTVISTRRTARAAENRLRANIYGEGENHKGIILSELPIRSVTQTDIKDHIYSVKERGREVLAGELLLILKQFFNWAVVNSHIKFSPIANLSKKDLGITSKPKPDHPLDIDDKGRPVTGLPEIKRFFDILDNDYPIKPRICFKILLLTGVRTNELRLAKKSHLDFDAMEWLIPKEHTKSYRPEKDNDTSLIVPLTDYVAGLFQELLEVSDDDKVVSIGQRYLPTAMPDIVKKGGFKYATPHSLRKSFRSHIIGWCSYQVAEKSLNHSLGQLDAAYDHGSLLDERREALQIWSDKVYRAVYGSESNVVPLRG